MPRPVNVVAVCVNVPALASPVSFTLIVSVP